MLPQEDALIILKQFLKMKAIILLALFGLMSTGIVPIGAKGETWLVNVVDKDKFLKNRGISFSNFSCVFLNPNNFFQFEF